MTKTAALFVVLALGAPHAATRPAVPIAALPSPPPPLGALPSIPRVRIDVASDHVIVTEDVNLPRGSWRSGELSFYVAFGAPGAPVAFDAHLLSVPDGSLEPAADDVGEKLVSDREARRPAKAYELLGADEMAGMVVHVPEAAFRRAVEPGGMAALRLRSLLRFPSGDGRSGYEVLVRLGQTRSMPLTLGSIQVGSIEDAKPILRAEAHLCGADADPWPLAVATGGGPRTLALPIGSQAPIAPVLAVRHAKEDLCVRFWPSS